MLKEEWNAGRTAPKEEMLCLQSFEMFFRASGEMSGYSHVSNEDDETMATCGSLDPFGTHVGESRVEDVNANEFER